MLNHPNPLLTLLLRHERHLSWRFVLLVAALLTGTVWVLLVALMLRVDNYDTAEKFEAAFSITYLVFLLGSLALPFFMALLGAILTTHSINQDEKFDLLRLTPLTDRAFAEAYFVVVLRRMRILIALQGLLAAITPMFFSVWQYWRDQPNTAFPSGYYYTDYHQTTLPEYIGVFLVVLEFHLALMGLAFIGMTMGVHFAMYYRRTTNAIATSIGSTLGVMWGLGVVIGCGAQVAEIIFGSPQFDGSIGESAGALSTTALCCILPIIGVIAWSLRAAARAVRRD